MIEFFRKWLSGTTLVDLGAGTGSMREVAEQFEISAYIGIDRHPFDQTPNPLQPYGSEERSRNWMLAFNVHADMLDFVSRLRRESIGGITINGIDDVAINDRDYHQALADEMLRVLQVNGLIFGNYSDSLNILSALAEKRKIQLYQPIWRRQMHRDNHIFGKSQL